MSAAIPSCRVVAVALCAALAFGAPAHAATPEEDAAIGLIREQFKDVDLRRVIEVSGKMKLDERSAKRFWPIYQSYLMDIVVMRDRQLDNLPSTRASSTRAGSTTPRRGRRLRARSSSSGRGWMRASA